MYAYWVCAARETPIFSPEFPFRSISISQITKKIRSGASPFYIFGGFCRSGDHHFQNFFNFNPFIASHGRLSPNAKRSAAPRVSGRSGDTHFHAQNRDQVRSGDAHFHAQTDQARSGAPHCYVQNGSSLFRSPTFSRSTGSSFWSPCQFFTLPRHMPTKIRGERNKT